VLGKEHSWKEQGSLALILVQMLFRHPRILNSATLGARGVAFDFIVIYRLCKQYFCSWFSRAFQSLRLLPVWLNSLQLSFGKTFIVLKECLQVNSEGLELYLKNEVVRWSSKVLKFLMISYGTVYGLSWFKKYILC